MLDGNDYVFQVSDHRLNVLILGASNAAQPSPMPWHVAATPVRAAPPPPTASAAKPLPVTTSLASSPPPALLNHNQLAPTPTVPPLSALPWRRRSHKAFFKQLLPKRCPLS